MKASAVLQRELPGSAGDTPGRGAEPPPGPSLSGGSALLPRRGSLPRRPPRLSHHHRQP